MTAAIASTPFRGSHFPMRFMTLSPDWNIKSSKRRPTTGSGTADLVTIYSSAKRPDSISPYASLLYEALADRSVRGGNRRSLRDPYGVSPIHEISKHYASDIKQ